MAHYFLANHEKRILCVLSPKCASVSLRAWFTEGALGRSGKDTAARGGSFQVPPGSVMSYRDYCKVFFVRDPLDRLVSFYADKVVRRSDQGGWCFADDDGRFDLEGKSFRQFLYVLDHLRRHRVNYQHHLVPQLRGAEGIVFDEIIRVERLAEGIARLNRVTGLSMAVPWINRGAYRGRHEPSADRCPQWLRSHGVPPPEWFYDEETRSLATAAYARDLAFYKASHSTDSS